jgi:polar amino acid transport system substrate-binding protein
MPSRNERLVCAPIRAITAALLVAAAVIVAAAGVARAQQLPDAALNRLLTEARSAVPAECSRSGIDRLARILCAGRIRIGVREYYPQFGTGTGNERQGYEIDVARAIAGRLGVTVEFEKVKAATRIPMLADNQIDLVIATMGHNTERDAQVRFIRPHYYRSETTIVGPRNLAIGGWADLAGKTVCVTVGNGSNAQLIQHDAHLMLFDDADELAARLEDDTCKLVAQDDSFFAYYFTRPAFAERFAQKFGFAQLPWGMAVARDGGERLARALDLMSQIFHRDGLFLGFARANRIATGFLEKQQTVWATPECDTATGNTNPACIPPPFNPALPATPFAGGVTAFEAWFAGRIGIDLVLPMLKTVPAWLLFLNGVVNSLVLVLGTLAAAFVFALLFGAMLGSPHRLLRWPARAATVTLQSSPIVLTLVVAAALMHAIFPYSAAMAMSAAILALGLTNGGNAGQAISEAMATVRAEHVLMPLGATATFHRALVRSATQLMGFLVNAAKGTPIAAFIGAPELLSALTDITSFSTGRATTYTLLLIFYTAVVMAVVWGCGRVRVALEHPHLPA